MTITAIVDPSTLNVVECRDGGSSYCAGCGGNICFSTCVKTVDGKFYSLCIQCLGRVTWPAKAAASDGRVAHGTRRPLLTPTVE